MPQTQTKPQRPPPPKPPKKVGLAPGGDDDDNRKKKKSLIDIPESKKRPHQSLHDIITRAINTEPLA